MSNKLYDILNLLRLNSFLIVLFILIVAIFFIRNIYANHQKYKKYVLDKKRKTREMLDYLYIPDISIELFDLLLFILGTGGILLFLRFFNLGKTINLWLVSNSNINYLKFIVIILIFYIFASHLTYLNKILIYKIFKLYLYLLQFPIFYDIMTFLNNHYVTFLPLYNYLCYYVKQLLVSNEKAFKYFDSYSLKFKILIYMRKKIIKNNRLTVIVENIHKILEKSIYILIIEEIIRNYFPQILLCVAIIMDLRNHEIYIFYYTICLYTLIMIYRKIRQIIREYDIHAIDIKLADYFYKDKTHEKVMQEPDDYEAGIIWSRSHYGSEIYEDYTENIRMYIERDYRIDYIDINFKKSYEPYNMRLLFLGIWLLYFFFCYNLSLVNNIIITLPLLLAIIIYEISYKYNKTIKYIIIYIILYILLLLFSMIIFIYIYLTRHNFYLLKETIWSLGFIIKQSFTLTEKMELMVQYLLFIMKKDTILTMEQKLYVYHILKNVNLFEFITENTTLIDIKNFCDNLIPITSQLINKHYFLQLEILQKIDIKELLYHMKEEQLLKNNYLYYLNNKLEIYLKKQFDTENKIILVASIIYFVCYLYMRRNAQDHLLQIEDKNTVLTLNDIIKYISKFFNE